jgi:hypothetical protein
MRKIVLAAILLAVTAAPSLAADWYIICVKLKIVDEEACVKCSDIYKVYSETKPAGGCTAVGMRPMVFETRKAALEWKESKCNCR